MSAVAGFPVETLPQLEVRAAQPREGLLLGLLLVLVVEYHVKLLLPDRIVDFGEVFLDSLDGERFTLKRDLARFPFSRLEPTFEVAHCQRVVRGSLELVSNLLQDRGSLPRFLRVYFEPPGFLLQTYVDARVAHRCFLQIRRDGRIKQAGYATAVRAPRGFWIFGLGGARG